MTWNEKKEDEENYAQDARMRNKEKGNGVLVRGSWLGSLRVSWRSPWSDVRMESVENGMQPEQGVVVFCETFYMKIWKTIDILFYLIIHEAFETFE